MPAPRAGKARNDQVRGTTETMTTSCCCPHSWLQGAAAAGPRKPAAATQLPAPVLVYPRQSLAYPSLLSPLAVPFPKLRDMPSSRQPPQGLFLCPGPSGSLPELSAPGTELAAWLPPQDTGFTLLRVRLLRRVTLSVKAPCGPARVLAAV